MGVGSKIAVFPNSLKSVGVAGVAAIDSNFQIGMEIIQPKDFYAVFSLYAHLRFVHDGTAVGRNIVSVTVQDDPVAATFSRSIVLNKTPDADLGVEAAIDVTSIANKSGRNIVMFTFNNHISGTIAVFKLDMLYQMKGIR